MGKAKDTGEEVASAKQRISQFIKDVDERRLKDLVIERPTLRGIVAGFLAEEDFKDDYLRGDYLGTTDYPIYDLEEPDDHDRSKNKADQIVRIEIHGEEHEVRFQQKSVQTNPIRKTDEGLKASVQNDGSDNREVKIPGTDRKVKTTCILVGDYDVLVVPTFPFSGERTWAFKLNSKCARTEHKKYRVEDRPYLLKTVEKITWPLSDDWTDDVSVILEQLIQERAEGSIEPAAA